MAHETKPTGEVNRQALAGLAPARPIEVVGPALVRTDRLALRPLQEDDREQYLRAIDESRDDLARWMPLHRPGESDQALFERQLELTRQGDEHGTAWRRVGVLPDGRIVGSFNLVSIARGLQLEADINWWVRSSLTRMGYGTEGVRALVDFSFMDLPRGLGLHRLHAGICADNDASIRLAERVGFRREDGVRSHLKVGGGWQVHEVFLASVLTVGTARSA